MLLEFLRLKSTYRNLNRVRQIVNVFLKHGFGQVIEQLNLQRVLPFRKRLKILNTPPELGHTIPERLRLAFSELGPSFIKLAQILSSRPDLITEEYASEFKKLQDEVPPFSFTEALRIMEEEFRRSPYELFDEIEKNPVAAASIAQVHNATLKDGSSVVIKIQRPNISEIIETDITILKAIASRMVKYIPESDFINPTGIVEEFSKTVRKELDFTEELKNISRFGRNFHKHPHITIPTPYAGMTSKRVIVMERIEGIRIDDIKGIDRLGFDRRELAKVGVDAYFKMFFEDGFFHADPHPGNIFVTPDGKIGLVDFGIVGWLSPEIMQSTAKALIALVKKDFDALIDQYIELGLVREEVDLEEFKKDFKSDIVDFLIPLYDISISQIDIVQYMDILMHLAAKHHLKIPSDLLLLDKCMLILDSVGRELDPDFNFISVAEPYAAKLVSSRYNPRSIYDKVQNQLEDLTDIAVKTPKQVRAILRKAIKDDIQFKINLLGLDHFIRDIDRSTNRLAFSIVIAAIILSSAILTLSGKGGVILDIPFLGLMGFLMAFFLGLWLLISIIRSGRL